MRALAELFRHKLIDLLKTLSTVFGDLVPLVVVDDVALEVEVSPMTVVSCVKNDTYCYNRFTILIKT